MKQDGLDELAKLSNRVARTYHSHLAMAKRLQRRDRNWTLALVTLSCVSALSAVSLIAKVDLYGRRGDVLWAIIGVTTLAISLVVANANYRERSVEAFSHYRVLQRQWVNLDFAASSVRSKRRRAAVARKLDREYQSLLDGIPNHSAADFFSSMLLFSKKNDLYDSGEWSHLRVGPFGVALSLGSRAASGILTFLPLLLALASLTALVPVIVWLLHGE